MSQAKVGPHGMHARDARERKK